MYKVGEKSVPVGANCRVMIFDLPCDRRPIPRLFGFYEVRIGSFHATSEPFRGHFWMKLKGIGPARTADDLRWA